MDEPILHFPYQFISQAWDYTTNISYLFNERFFSFLCVNIRFDLEDVDRYFRESITNTQVILHVEARSSLCEGDTYRSTKFPWSALPIPPSFLFGGKVKVSISPAWESINPLPFLEMPYENALAKLVTQGHASSAANHPRPYDSSFSPSPRHHAGSPSG